MVTVTSTPWAHCPGHCSHGTAWHPQSSPAAALASGDQAVMSSGVIISAGVKVSNCSFQQNSPGRERSHCTACSPSLCTWCWNEPLAPGGWRLKHWGPWCHQSPSPKDDFIKGPCMKCFLWLKNCTLGLRHVWEFSLTWRGHPNSLLLLFLFL